MSHLQLREFVALVKAELRAASGDASADNLLQIQEIELEVSFTLDASGGAKAKLLVVDLETLGKSSRTHKVKLKLLPATAVPRTAEDKIDINFIRQSGTFLNTDPAASLRKVSHTTQSDPWTPLSSL